MGSRLGLETLHKIMGAARSGRGRAPHDWEEDKLLNALVAKGVI